MSHVSPTPHTPAAEYGAGAQGTLYIVSAPSGAGKTSLVRALLQRNADIGVSVSHTTRAMRPGEQDGVNYHFVSQPEFEAMVERGEFFEHAWVFDRHYGTSRVEVEKRLAVGEDVILELDWQGAQQVRAQAPDAESIFILPPSTEELNRRLHSRAQDPEDVVAARMAKASNEISHWAEYHYIIVNRDLDESVSAVHAILNAERLRRERQVGLTDFVKRLRDGQ